jgi:hypothetical protein
VTANLKLPALENLKKVIHDLGGSHALEIELRDDEQVAKAEYLKATGRDFFSVTTSMQAAMLAALRRATPGVLASGNPTPAYDAVKATAREWIVRRFLTQGPDVRLRPLSKDYLARKRAHELMDTRVGIARGTLLRAVRTAPMRLRKVR